MKSYRCPQCGFVTSIATEKCKICGLPNINVNQALAVSVGASPQIYTQPFIAFSLQETVVDDFGIALTPPNEFRELPPRVEVNDQKKAPKNIAAKSLFAPYTLDAFAMEMADKDIGLAWKAGRLWCFLIFATIILMLFAFFLDSSTTDLSALLPFLMTAMMLAAGGILSYGVYQKNRICATILVGLAGVSVVLNLWNVIFTQEIGGILRLFLACVFGYYFALGVRGTFKYHKLMST